VLFIGQKNLSLEVAQSQEFYNLLVYFIAYGLFLSGADHPLEKAA
jgi:hypothetical protein